MTGNSCRNLSGEHSCLPHPLPRCISSPSGVCGWATACRGRSSGSPGPSCAGPRRRRPHPSSRASCGTRRPRTEREQGDTADNHGSWCSWKRPTRPRESRDPSPTFGSFDYITQTAHPIARPTLRTSSQQTGEVAPDEQQIEANRERAAVAQHLSPWPGPELCAREGSWH